MRFLNVAEKATRHLVRAKYIPQVDGSLRLALVQAFSAPTFRESGWENHKKPQAFDALEKITKSEEAKIIKGDLADLERASRRAKINAFDMILCNPDLNTFVTFTYSPDKITDKASYDECYKKLAVWLSNRVQRNGLKYVLVPERHKSGDIHFHAIMNSSALKLKRAYGPSGRAINHKGRKVYNVSDWNYGFTTAEIIGGTEGDRDAVAKYVFKYMGKQLGQRIGGRYALIGGAMAKPVFVYGEDPDEFLGGLPLKYDREVNIGENLTYKEYSLI